MAKKGDSRANSGVERVLWSGEKNGREVQTVARAVKHVAVSQRQ